MVSGCCWNQLGVEGVYCNHVQELGVVVLFPGGLGPSFPFLFPVGAFPSAFPGVSPERELLPIRHLLRRTEEIAHFRGEAPAEAVEKERKSSHCLVGSAFIMRGADGGD